MAGHNQPLEQPGPGQRIQAPTPRVALVIAAAVVVGVVLYLGRDVLAPFIIGALLVYVLDPAVTFVSRLRVGSRSIPRGLAVLIVYILAFVVVAVGLALLLGPLVSQLIDYLRDLPRLLDTINRTLIQLGEAYRSLALPEPIRAFVDKALADLSSGAGEIDFSSLLPIARTVAGTAAGLFGFLIIPIWAFYILRDRVRLTDKLADSLPPTWRDEVWAVLTIIERIFGRWLRAQILLGLIIGGTTWAGLMVLGWLVDPRFGQFAVLLAVVAGLFELLPIIGPILAMIPTLLVALTTRDPALSVVAVLALYTAIQQVEGAVLVPWIQGDAVSLHPSIVVFVLILGGAIAGLLGAILSVPVTAAAFAVYRYLFKRLSPADEGPGPPTTEAVVEEVTDDHMPDVEEGGPATQRRRPTTKAEGTAG